MEIRKVVTKKVIPEIHDVSAKSDFFLGIQYPEKTPPGNLTLRRPLCKKVRMRWFFRHFQGEGVEFF